MVWAACRKPRKGAVTRSNSYDDESYLNGIIAVHERMVQLRYNPLDEALLANTMFIEPRATYRIVDESR